MKIFQLEIWRYSYENFCEEIIYFMQNSNSGKGKSVFTPNPEICLKTLEDEDFLGILKQADYLTSDGIGLYIWYQINNSQLPKIFQFFMIPYYIFNVLFRKKMLYKKYWERICGSDITQKLVEYAEKNKIRIAILDPYFPDDAQKCAAQKIFKEQLQKKFPDLLFDFYIHNNSGDTYINEAICKSDAKIFFATLWMKQQEIMVLDILAECPNIRLWLAVGSSFDYFTWFQKRAPKIFRDAWFEWLYRIFTSPNKLKRIGRIYKALIVFPIKVLFYK